MPFAAGTGSVSVLPTTSNSTPVRPALCLLSQRKPVSSGSQQRGCQAAGQGQVYPAGPREALALRLGSGECWEEWHHTQGEAADSGGARGSSASPGREVTEQAVGSGSETEWE